MPDALSKHADQIYSFVEKKLVDPDGLVHSTINAKTQKPLKDKDLPDQVCFKQLAAPKKLWKAAFFGYEDSNMATAEYLLANIYKYQATNDLTAKKTAQRTFKALKAVAMAGTKYQGPALDAMFGYLPKPYGGIKTAHLSGEVSIDQYLRTMYAMTMYRDVLANKTETNWINKFLPACADCWAHNNYSFQYFMSMCRWGIGAAHSVAFALFCSAVGMKLGDKDRHKNWFNIFLDRSAPLEKAPSYNQSTNAASLTIMSMKELCKYQPRMKAQWIKYAKTIFKNASAGVDKNGHEWLFTFLSGQKRGELIKPHWDPAPAKYWEFMKWRANIFVHTQLPIVATDMYDLTGEEKYAKIAKKQLALFDTNEPFKHLNPLTSKDLPKGYEILGQLITGMGHTYWLRAYWQLRANNKL